LTDRSGRLAGCTHSATDTPNCACHRHRLAVDADADRDRVLDASARAES